ncbi:MAG: DUF2505 domain-containing protein [Frankiaceae bacterium]|nr:DUF2505 domain-containing protein [Frankiaceae bacterium]MBV9869327.1 DUF2505 domain-containing protein [Frankiaceae bacterium]
MATTFKLTHHYDQDVETVFALITDPDFIRRKYEALGGRDIDADREDTGDGGCKVVTKRTMTIDLPGFAAKVMSPTNTAVQTEVWQPAGSDGTRRCTYHVDFQGVPSKVGGTLTLSPDGGGTKQTVEADVKVSIPLIGGKLEKFGIETGTQDINEQVDFTIADLDG